jgi:hypothetical protein
MSRRWRSSGREPWIFRAHEPEDLCGAHAELIRSTLLPGEGLRYLLYSPIFDAEGGPFGIRGEPASHAIAVTAGRFLISTDSHRSAIPPSVEAVPFESIRWIEVGAALLLGWLVIRVADVVSRSPVIVLFRASGAHHVAAAVRAYRRSLGGIGPLERAGRPWGEVLGDTPPCLRSELQPLFIEDERAWGAVVAPERWISEQPGRRKVPVCLSTCSALVVADRGVLWAASEPAARPGALRFGVNVWCIAPGAVTSAALETRDSYGARVNVIALQVGRGAETHLEIPLADEARPHAEEAVRVLQASLGVRCSPFLS